MKEQLEKAVKSCAEKAAQTERGAEAMQFTQAAVNAINALNVLQVMEIEKNR